MGVGEFEPAEGRRDRELTLGLVMLLSLFCGLVLLCGVVFGFGYAAGRRGTVPAASGAPSAATPMQVVATDAAKPMATSQQPCEPQQVDIANSQATGNVLGDPAANTQNGGWQPVASAPAQARPGMTAQEAGGNGQTGMGAPPASQHVPLLMVQVAAVSHVQDARVLMSALQKRGYAVMSRRELSDGLIHVQIGPFSSRDDANAMTQRLLSDGYNAIIVP